MPTANWTVVVNKPPEEVFAYLADIRKHGEWSPKPWRAEGLAEGPVGVGTKFTSIGWIPRDADHHNDVEVVELDPPHRMKLISREKGEQFVNTFVLTPSDGGTKVDRTLELPRPPGFGGVVFPLLLAGFIKPAVGKGMRMFKHRLESSTT